MKINQFLDKYSKFAPTILRIGLGFVFAWFGYMGLSDTSAWVKLVPEWATALADAETLVKIHGAVELIFGIFLIFGVKLRLAATILFISLLHTLTLVKGGILIRDIGLAAALLALILRPR